MTFPYSSSSSRDSGMAASSDWFHVSPVNFPFTEDVVDQILSRRQDLDGKLFFDELLSLAALDTQLYPPTSPGAFSALVDEIMDCQWDTLKKDCLVYYLLKHWNDGRHVKFASQRSIPPGFTAIADAYFHLDEEEFHLAVRCLCDLRVTPDFVPKILRALKSSSASLVVKFVRAVKPLLQEPESLDIYVRALCEFDFVQAWLFQRTFPEDKLASSRHRFVALILDHCLIPKPLPAAIQCLITFPFTAFEQDLINTYAISPSDHVPESSLAILQDLINVRLIHQGRYGEAIRLDKLFVKEAASAGRMGPGSPIANAAEKRRETFKELIAVLPQVQRRLLDLGEDIEKESAAQKPNGADAQGDLAMSWEEIEQPASAPRNPRPVSSAPVSASPAFRHGNPKVAVLKAFAQSSSSRMEGSPSPSNNHHVPIASRPQTSQIHAQTKSMTPTSNYNSPFAPRAPTNLFAQSSSAPSPAAKNPFTRDAPTTHPSGLRFNPTFEPSTSTASSPFRSTVQSDARPQARQPSNPVEDTARAQAFLPQKNLHRTPFAPHAAKHQTDFTLNSTVTPTKRTHDVSQAEGPVLWQAEDADVDMIEDEDDIDLEPPVPAFRYNRRGNSAAQQSPPDGLAPTGLVASASEELAQQDTSDLFPGAFPSEAKLRLKREAAPTWISPAPAPVKPESTPSISNGKSKTTRAKKPKSATSKPTQVEEATPAKPAGRTPRVTRAASAVPDDAEDGRQLRRSTRLSVAPSSPPAPERKKLRSSVEREGTASPQKPRSSSKKPRASATPSGRTTRRQPVSVLENLEE